MTTSTAKSFTDTPPVGDDPRLCEVPSCQQWAEHEDIRHRIAGARTPLDFACAEHRDVRARYVPLGAARLWSGWCSESCALPRAYFVLFESANGALVAHFYCESCAREGGFEVSALGIYDVVAERVFTSCWFEELPASRRGACAFCHKPPRMMAPCTWWERHEKVEALLPICKDHAQLVRALGEPSIFIVPGPGEPLASEDDYDA